MERLFGFNPGLLPRIAHHVDFPEYRDVGLPATLVASPDPLKGEE
jgi:hypothetical protein